MPPFANLVTPFHASGMQPSPHPSVTEFRSVDVTAFPFDINRRPDVIDVLSEDIPCYRSVIAVARNAYNTLADILIDLKAFEYSHTGA